MGLRDRSASANGRPTASPHLSLATCCVGCCGNVRRCLARRNHSDRRVCIAGDRLDRNGVCDASCISSRESGAPFDAESCRGQSMNERSTRFRRPIIGLAFLAAGIVTGTGLGGLDWSLQGNLGPNSFWTYSWLVFGIPIVFLVITISRPPSVRFWLFALPIPQTYQATTMTCQNLERGVPLDATFHRYVFEIGIMYFFLCILPSGLAAFCRHLLTWRLEHGPGKCSNCGYDLTGNTSGVCPECGTRIAASNLST